MTRGEPVLPTLRAAVFAAVCLGLGVTAHRLMSGAAIPAWAMVLGGFGAYVPARLGTRRERGLAGIIVLMGVAQVALHLLFAFAQDTAVAAATMPARMPMSAPMSAMHGASSGSSASMPGMAMPGMGMPGTAVPGMTAHGTGMPGTALHGMSMSGAGGAMRMSVGMLLGHVLAAAICAWWLRRGEAAVHRLACSAAGWALVRICVAFHVLPVRPAVTPIASRIEPVALALRSQWLRTVRPLRGPPSQAPSFA
jgi:hypothetical protein